MYSVLLHFSSAQLQQQDHAYCSITGPITTSFLSKPYALVPETLLQPKTLGTRLYPVLQMTCKFECRTYKCLADVDEYALTSVITQAAHTPPVETVPALSLCFLTPQ